MTKNKITRETLMNELTDIEFNKNDYSDPEPYRDKVEELYVVLKSETNVSLQVDKYIDKGDNLILRNVQCAINCLNRLNEYNYYEAWWELTDIISYRKDKDYISENEIALLYIMIVAFKNTIGK